MTLIVKGIDTGPIPASYLQDAPVGSWVAFRYIAEQTPLIYRKQADGLWLYQGSAVVVDSEAIAFGWRTCPYWSLHHPGLVKVCLLPISGRRGWFCRVCNDVATGFDQIGEAISHARAHVRNHAEIARAL